MKLGVGVQALGGAYVAGQESQQRMPEGNEA